MTLAEEFEFYQQHFDRTGPEVEHAFYMGALRMLQWCRTRPKADLKALAIELDAYLESDPCMCASCRAKRAAGVAYSLAESLF